MAKVEDYGNGVWLFWCPACREHHPFHVVHADHPTGPKWTFNGNVEKPTFSPSLRVFARKLSERVTACHLFVRDGRIEYCQDCPHEFAGKTVDMVDMPVD